MKPKSSNRRENMKLIYCLRKIKIQIKRLKIYSAFKNYP